MSGRYGTDALALKRSNQLKHQWERFTKLFLIEEWTVGVGRVYKK